MSNPHIPLAFIGTGIMGLPMATHLLDAGHALTVHTRTKAKAQPLFDRGAKWAASPREAAAGAEVVFLNLPDTPDVQAVVLGEAGVIHSAGAGLIVVDHSTISPSVTRRIAAELARKSAHFLDAPVSGGDVGARNATLSIMVGGDGHAFARALPLLSLLGKSIVHTGESGTGQLTKLVNQILVAGTLEAVCEAMTFAVKNGLDADKTLGAVGAGAAGSWQLSNLGPRMVKGDFAPGFMIDLMLKDLGIVAQSALEAKLALPGASLTRELFAKAKQAGLGRQGTQGLYAVVQEAAGAVPPPPSRGRDGVGV